MKKTISILAVLSLFALAGTAFAGVDRVAGDWDLTAPNGIVFSCLGNGSLFEHTLDTDSQDENGDLTGTGHYDANTGYTWDLTGNVSGDDISFTITYTGISAGSVYNSIGTIAENGSISGTTDSNCQAFSMPAGTAERFEGNHGQYVSSQDDKKAAAQSRVGMPSQSKGHTK